VALWLCTRDNRAYCEGAPGATKPSSLKILTSPDFQLNLNNALGYGFKLHMRPQRPPCTLTLLGSTAPKKCHAPINIQETNDPASQASPIGQTPVSEVQQAPTDGG
jgi:hypothetical protein